MARRLCFLRGGNWQAELEAFLENGWVLSTPECFAMGRMTQRADYFPEPWEKWEEGSDFFTWIACGRLSDLVAHLPAGVNYLGFHRQNRGWTRNRWLRLDVLTRTR